MQLRKNQKLKKGGGGFEDYPEQLVLSPSAEETMPAQNRAKRGNRRAEEQESNNYELFFLLTGMREYMKRRDEKLKEELSWRDNNQSIKDKNREESLVALLQ